MTCFSISVNFSLFLVAGFFVFSYFFEFICVRENDA